jgi:hypothetical protein
LRIEIATLKVFKRPDFLACFFSKVGERLRGLLELAFLLPGEYKTENRDECLNFVGKGDW